MSTQFTAADLDDALIRMKDALSAMTAEERADLAASMPPNLRAQADQIRAAYAVARDLVMLAATHDGFPAPIEGGDVPDGVRLGALDTALKWTRGTRRTCMHRPNPNHPQPVVSVA